MIIIETVRIKMHYKFKRPIDLYLLWGFFNARIAEFLLIRKNDTINIWSVIKLYKTVQ